jgi:GNAT superfamily N-acetyltransferase
MLHLASIDDAGRLAKVKEGFGEADVLARFQWLSTVNVNWYIEWVANDPVGWVLIHWDGKSSAPDYPDLFDLYVHATARNHGVGTQILQACEQMVREAGHGKVGLAVNPELNPRAYALYQRLGYYVVRQEKYLDGVYNGVEDWVIDLEKNL